MVSRLAGKGRRRMAKCSQCHNNAMYEVEGHLLCLQCAKVWHDMCGVRSRISSAR